MRQSQVDIENSGVDGASEPLLPVAMGAAPATAPGVKTTNCCMIACCAPLAIKNGGGPPPEPKPEPTPTSSAAPVHHHKAWATVFKANVVFTVAAAALFGGMALEALSNDSLTGEGRRRLMHEHHGDHSHHHSHHHHASGEFFSACVFPVMPARSLSLWKSTFFFAVGAVPSVPRVPLSFVVVL